MRLYWLWLSAWGVLCFVAVVGMPLDEQELPLRLVAGALFFSAFFLARLTKERPVAMTVLLVIMIAAATVGLWPSAAASGPSSPYALLIYSLLAVKAAYRLPLPGAALAGALLLLASLLPGWAGYQSYYPPLLLVAYAGLCAFLTIAFRRLLERAGNAEARSEALLSEYRSIKRKSISAEEITRSDERARIARDMHDSVGHKLTALLMQLEIYRMEHDDARVAAMKQLAKDSLEETRDAVKALKEEENGGLFAIVHLIRKLEAENLFSIHFSVKHRAMSAPLNAAQSIAVYRAVQEGLTNVMRHGDNREAEVRFEAPGQGMFRFEIVNALQSDKPYREGFGLKSMRERLEQAGGKLEVVRYERLFIVRGMLSTELQKRRSANDSHFVGGRSETGASRLENDD